jgi:hypothetical protein
MMPSPTVPTTSADEWSEWLVSTDPRTGVDDSPFDFSVPLPGLHQNNLADRTNVANSLPLDNSAAGGRHHSTLNSFTLNNGGLNKDNPLFPTPAQTDAGFGSSSSAGNSPSVRRSPDGNCASTALGKMPTVGRPLSVPQCRCLMRTLEFLAQLSMDPSEAWTVSENSDSPTQRPILEQVLSQIENMSAEVGKVLQCACSNNCDLLVLLSVVIFKVLAWYAAAVNAATSEDDESKALDSTPANQVGVRPRLVLPTFCRDLDGDETEGEDQRRIFVQHILSRLSAVQSLISRLSKRLANAEAESSAFPPVARGPLHSILARKISDPPFSASLLRALSMDLRDGLCGLSRAIADKL